MNTKYSIEKTYIKTYVKTLDFLKMPYKIKRIYFCDKKELYQNKII